MQAVMEPLWRVCMQAVIEPLWRENFANLDILPDTSVASVEFDSYSGSDSGSEGNSSDGSSHIWSSDNGEDTSSSAGQLDSIVATGVRTTTGDAYRAKQVVVAAGALESPALLMRSGIGPGQVCPMHSTHACTYVLV